MNQKTTLGLVIALIVGLGAMWWVESSGKAQGEKAAVGPKPLFDPEPGEIAEFEWVLAGAAPLKFKIPKDKWQITEPFSGPAEHFVVANDVTKLKELKYTKAYPRDDKDRPTPEMAGLATPQRVAKLVDKNGKAFVIKIGSRQTLSAKTYVQKEGDETIYVVDSDLGQDMKHAMADYRGKRVCEFNAADATRIEATGEAQFVFVQENGKWMADAPTKARGDNANVNTLVRTLSQLNAEKFVDDAPKSLRPYGLDRPRLVLSATTQTKTPRPAPPAPTSAPTEPQFDITTSTIRIAFGGSADDKVFARVEEPAGPAVFQIPDATFKQLAKKLDDLRDKSILELDPAKAQRIAVNSGTERVELLKKDGQWQISSGLAAGETATAEFAAVDDLLMALKELKAVGYEAVESPSHGFKNAKAVIEVASEGKMEPDRLTVGAATPSNTGTYIRNDREGYVAVIKSESMTALLRSPIEFLGRDLIKFNREMASRIDLLFPKYAVTAQKDGTSWKLTSPVKGEVESGAVGAILADLAQLRGRRVVARANDARKFGLDAPTVKVAVTVENPPRVKEAPPTTQPGPAQPQMESVPPSKYEVSLARFEDKAYAMAPGGSVVCEIDAKVVDDALAEFLNTKVTPIEPSQARRLACEGSQKFAFEKSGDTWNLVGESTFSTDPAKIVEVFSTLNNMKAKEFARYTGAKPAEFGLAPPEVTITAETSDLKTISLLISSKGPAAGGRFACLGSMKDRVFVIKQEDVAKLLKSVKDFQKSG